MIRRTLAVVVKELRQLRRDARTTLALLGMPMILLLLYGYALSFDVRAIRLAVVDQDGGRAARELADAFLATDAFELASTVRDVRLLDPLFDSGRVQAALVIPPRYGDDRAAGRPTAVQVVLDGSDAQTATAVLGYARQIVAAAAPVLRQPRSLGPVVPAVTVWYNPDLSSSRFLVPGLLGFILMVTAVIATALAVVREKERGTMESLRATPLVAVELLVGKTLPYLLVGSLAAGGAVALAWTLFDVPVRGSLLALAAVTLLFLAGGLGLGVLISTMAETQQVAFQAALLISMLPTLLLSGFVFPISSMPPALRVITHIVPARYYLVALRGIVLKGTGPEAWGMDVVALAVFAVVVLALATVRTVRSL